MYSAVVFLKLIGLAVGPYLVAAAVACRTVRELPGENSAVVHVSAQSYFRPLSESRERLAADMDRFGERCFLALPVLAVDRDDLAMLTLVLFETHQYLLRPGRWRYRRGFVLENVELYRREDRSRSRSAVVSVRIA